MPTFCATAPAISEEQERKELEELSEEDRWALECDLKGTEHQSSRSPVGPLTPDALHFLQEALESIPKDEKADYLLAMEHNCDLVEQESPAAAFLRRSKMDPWQAARQMVDYWRIRRMLFGELALLPMTIEGALQLDAETLAQEYIVVFEDAHGRPAFYFDRVRVPVGSKMRDSVLRCLFYHYQHMAKSAKTGIVAVYNWRVRFGCSYRAVQVGLLRSCCVNRIMTSTNTTTVSCSSAKYPLKPACQQKQRPSTFVWDTAFRW